MSDKLMNECIHLSQQFIHDYYHYRIEQCLPYIDEHMVWIGSYDFQYAHGKNEFIKIIKQRKKAENNTIKIKLSNEYYKVVNHYGRIWTIESHFFAHTTLSDQRYLLAKIRCTFIWQKKKDQFLLIHLHVSHARDIPLIYDSAFEKDILDNYTNLFQYINNIDTLENKYKRTAYTDIDGIVHYLLPSEIIYVSVSDKICTIHTFGNPIIVRSSLSDILNQSPFLLQVHKQYLVNHHFVQSIKRYEMTLINNIIIPVSQKNYLMIKNSLETIK